MCARNRDGAVGAAGDMTAGAGEGADGAVVMVVGVEMEAAEEMAVVVEEEAISMRYG